MLRIFSFGAPHFYAYLKLTHKPMFSSLVRNQLEENLFSKLNGRVFGMNFMIEVKETRITWTRTGSLILIEFFVNDSKVKLKNFDRIKYDLWLLALLNDLVRKLQNEVPEILVDMNRNLCSLCTRGMLTYVVLFERSSEMKGQTKRNLSRLFIFVWISS